MVHNKAISIAVIPSSNKAVPICGPIKVSWLMVASLNVFSSSVRKASVLVLFGIFIRRFLLLPNV